MLFSTALGALAPAVTGCADPAPAVATVTAGVDRPAVPLGGPIELSLRFAVSPDPETLAEAIDGDYRVFVHFLDDDGKWMWAADHDPDTPTSAWRPGEVIAYTRFIMVPIYPYVGEAIIAAGLYSPESDARLALAGEDLGERSYRVAAVRLEPQDDSSFLFYEDGWYDGEYDPGAGLQWRWTAERASLTFRNPRSDAALYLRLGGRPDRSPDGRQRVEVRAGDALLHEVVLDSEEPAIAEVTLPADRLGEEEAARVDLHVSPTFVPSETPGGGSRDDRRLGVRVYYAFIETR